MLTYLFAFKATVENEKHLAKRKEVSVCRPSYIYLSLSCLYFFFLLTCSPCAQEMDKAEKERNALLVKADQADLLAQQAAREKAALERERQRLADEEARRRAEEDARRAAEVRHCFVVWMLVLFHPSSRFCLVLLVCLRSLTGRGEEASG